MDNETLSSENILRNFGGHIKNNLENIINAEQEDDELDIICHSPYYAPDNLPKVLCDDDSKLTVLSLNAQSINAKFGGLETFMSLFEQQNINFDVICLQETWLEEHWDTSLLQLEGYSCISQGKSVSSHGGLITYISTKYNFNRLDCSPTSEIWEGLFVEISEDSGTSKTVIANIYKPPKENNRNEHIENFISELEPFLAKFSRTNTDTILAGDFNINLLQINERLVFANFLDKLLGHGFYPKITLPTRLGKHSSTIIDNFFCKLSANSITTVAGIIVTALSDHFPYFLCMDKSIKSKTKPAAIVKQKINTPSAIAALRDDLISRNIYDSLDHNLESDPNRNYEIILNHITEAKSEHLPFRFVKFNKHKHKRNKWMPFGLVKSIAFRDKMHLKLKCTNQGTAEYNILKQNLSTFNVILKKAIKQAKINYNNNIFDKYKNDIKKTWKNIAEILNKSNKKKLQH